MCLIYKMHKCEYSVYLSYISLIYMFASLYYYIRTRSIGTPFNDTLSEEQIKVKKESGRVRMRFFVHGLVLGFIIILLLQPFKEC